MQIKSALALPGSDRTSSPKRLIQLRRSKQHVANTMAHALRIKCLRIHRGMRGKRISTSGNPEKLTTLRRTFQLGEHPLLGFGGQ